MHALRGESRVQTAVVENLVDVDVPQASDHVLVEENTLERAGPPREHSLESPDTEILRLRSQTGEKSRGLEPRAQVELDAPEATWIGEAQFATVVQGRNHVGVLRTRQVRRRDPESAGHPQVHAEREFSIEIHEDELAASAEPDHTPAVGRVGRESLPDDEHSREDLVQRAESAAAEVAAEAAYDVFDFGEFWHRATQRDSI
jgi:hypothetical protein